MLILQSLLVIAQGVIAVSMIALILLQHGRGADAGTSFGGGSSSAVFGSRGPANFLSRTTAVLAALFVVNCLTLAYLAREQAQSGSVLESLEAPRSPEQDAFTDATVPVMPEAQDDAGAAVPVMPEDQDDADAAITVEPATVPILPEMEPAADAVLPGADPGTGIGRTAEEGFYEGLVSPGDLPELPDAEPPAAVREAASPEDSASP